MTKNPMTPEAIHNLLTALPEAVALRRAAKAWAESAAAEPIDGDDSVADLANRRLLAAATDFTNAIHTCKLPRSWLRAAARMTTTNEES